MNAVDLFAGAGGFSTGARLAGARVLWAANHSPVAVQWHAANHPETAHACQDLQQADFRDAPEHDLLLASPCCQGHSRARGSDKPHHDTQRSTAWAVVSCAEVHRPQIVVVENVPEFSRWVLWPAWCSALHALGYAISPIIVDAADTGVPQHRRRLFVVCTRSRHPVDLSLPRREHAPVNDIIHWDAGNWSAIEKPGRASATLARIEAGRRTHGDRFLIAYYGNEYGGRSLQRPVGTITTRARWAVIDGPRMRMLLTNEAKAAMGFPADYALPVNHAACMQLLGNAVVPKQAADVLNAIRRAA